MPSKPIASRQETTKEKRADVWVWYKVGKTYSEIGRLTGLSKWNGRKDRTSTEHSVVLRPYRRGEIGFAPTT
jgi:hypothetical protein